MTLKDALKRISVILISFWLSVAAIGQTVEQTIAFADRQKNFGNIELAISAYKRALFFDRQNLAEDTYRKIADCYLELNQYGEAAGYYDLAYAASPVDSVQQKVLLNKAFCLLAEQQYALALVELLSLESDLSKEQEQRKNFYLGIAYFGQDKFEQSQDHFLKAVDYAPAETKDAIAAIFKRNEKVSRLKPKTARTLSMIFPGLGQFYAGDIKNGLNSILLTGGLVVLFVYTASSFTVLDALISVGPWYQRYYTGGYKKAEMIARDKLNEKRNVIYLEIIRVVSEAKANHQ